MNVKHENEISNDVQKVVLVGLDPETVKKSAKQDVRILGWALLSIVIFVVLFVILGALTGPLTFILSPVLTFLFVRGLIRMQKQTENGRKEDQ